MDRCVVWCSSGAFLFCTPISCCNNSYLKRRLFWTVPTKPTNIGHFASYPEELITPCILAGCPEEGTVLDPFNGIATTGLAALNNNRNYIGIELSKEYCELSEDRIKNRFYNLKYKEVRTEIQDTFF